MFDVEHSVQRYLYGATLCMGLGALAGALESIALAVSLKLPLGTVGFFLLGSIDVAVMALAGTAMGLVWAGFLWLPTRAMLAPQALSWQMGLTGGGLCAYYLWPRVPVYWAASQLPQVAVLVLVPLFFVGVVYFNAQYWLRRQYYGIDAPVPWRVLAPAAALLVVGVGSAAYTGRETGGDAALAGDPNVLLITIDTLRRDHVGAYGSLDAPPTPFLDALAREGILFLDAVTPMPETAPAHASMLTGLHPLRHGLLSNGHQLGWRETLASRLTDEGYATGAFVSSFAVHSRTGLDEGFLTYDDGFVPGLPGVARIDIIKKLITAWMVLGDPASTPWLLEREGERTLDSFAGWLDRNPDAPFFAWVHLFEPHAPYEPHGLAGFESNGAPGAPAVDHRLILPKGEAHDYTDSERAALRALYREEVAYTDQLVGELLGQLEDRGLAENTLVVVTADHGENLGEHGLDFQHHGLFDDVVRVPLIVRAPALKYAKTTRVEQQVRLMDIAPTVLDYLQLDPMDQAEGVDLLGYAEGVRTRSLWSPLVGRRARALSDGALLGMRNNGIKYIRDVNTGEEQLFSVVDDPDELVDISAEQQNALAQARQLLSPEVASLERHLGQSAAALDASSGAMLEALGYQE